MVRIREIAAGLSGWRRWLLCVALGALSAAALPPLHALPVLMISFPALIWWLETSPRVRDAFAISWCFGFGHFVIGFYWLANAFLVDAERFAWLIPFAVLGLPAVLALFPAIAGAIFKRIGVSGVIGVVAFAVLWTLSEWVRGQIFTGFPWNLIGYSWAFSNEIVQLTAIVGVYGLSVLTVAIAGLPALLATDANGWRRVGPLLAALALLGAAWGYGHARLESASRYASSGTTVRVVQANVAQANKWRADRRDANFRRYLFLSEGTGKANADVILWPETAVPYFLSREIGRRLAIGSLVGEGRFVITGAPRILSSGAGETRIWNSVVAINHAGEIAATYDKFHLVPFGEYLPLRRILSSLGIGKLVYGSIDYTAGAGPTTLQLGDLPPVGPLVCYEVIFPGAVVDRLRRPAWLLNVSNDGWYGLSAGPYQHFAMARFRSVEEGLPLVRAANTGISGVIDSFGRVIAKISLGEVGVIDVDLPQPIETTPIYGRYGDLVWLGIVVAMVVVSLFSAVMTRTARGE